MCREVGATRVQRVRALRGGESSAVHLLQLEGAGGERTRVVLRRYVLDWITAEPWTPRNETVVLRWLTHSNVLAPELLAADLNGSVSGTPAIVMTALPGRLDWEPQDFDQWQARLVTALQEIHAVPLSAELQPFAPYPAEHTIPPRWTRHQWAWELALELYEQGPPGPTASTFIHRDFHPGNVLWTRGQITGVVDWVNGCAGPAEADVAHCRENIARQLGQGAADHFLVTWLSATGVQEFHPYWDLTNILSMVGEQPDRRLDNFAVAAARRL